MKILMLGSGSYNSSLSIRLVALAKGLATQDHKIILMMPAADKYNNFKAEKVQLDANVKLIHPWQFNTTKVWLNLLPYIFGSIFMVIRQSADVIYLYKPTPITIVGLLPRLIFGTPVILDLDDLGSEVMKAQHQSPVATKLVAWSERLSIRLCSAAVVTSTYLENYLNSKQPGKAVQVLPNGVDMARYHSPLNRTPRPLIYYFGYINRLSLIEPLLQAMPAVLKKVPHARLVIFGDGSALTRAKAKARQLGIEHATEFKGWTDMYAVQNSLQLADLAVCYQPDTPTVRAASNMKVFQYMAMGSATIVSRVGDMPDYIQGGAGVAVEPNNPHDLTTTITQLLLDPTRRIAMAQAGRRRASTVYSWTILSAKLARFISQNESPARTRLHKEAQ